MIERNGSGVAIFVGGLFALKKAQQLVSSEARRFETFCLARHFEPSRGGHRAFA